VAHWALCARTFSSSPVLQLVGVLSKLPGDLILDTQHGVVESPFGGDGLSTRTRGERACGGGLPHLGR